MELLQEVVGVPNKDISHIVKGKRTKRLRPQSPIPFTITTHPSTVGGEDDTKNQECVVVATTTTTNVCNNDDNNNNNHNNNLTLSRTNSVEVFLDTPTKEDEETARCLLLLSKGDPREFMKSPPNKFDLFNDDIKLYQNKFNSKRYIETPTTSGNGGKAGMYVYECKTCSRTFPSFQALGGHRTSHKKQKPLMAIEASKKPYSSFNFSDDDDQPSPSTWYKNNNNNNNNKMPSPSPLSAVRFNDKSSPRIHECSYCGAEFTSGQALGGHMRRHRGGANANTNANANANTHMYLSPLSPANSIESEILKKSRCGLDLNQLPAPDDQSKNVLHQPSKQQNEEENSTQRQSQQKEPELAIVLSTAPKLVDCHF